MNRRNFLRTSAAATLSWNAFGQGGKRPNILFFIADDWGHQHAGVYGCNWVKTPNIDRVAKEGVLFKNCFTSNPKCSPCRATILTGRNTWQLKEAINHNSIFPNDFAVFPDLLEKAGYFVGMTGKGWGPGDYKSTGWTRNPAGPEYQARTLKPPFNGISNRDYAGNFDDFLAKRKPGQPFSFWFGTQEPHRFYEEGSGVRAGRKPADVTVPQYLPDNAAIRKDLLDYALEVEWNDLHLGRALASLEKAGELDNTLIIVTSDHGMPFPRVKGQIYEDGFHIPLMIRWGSQIKAGRVVEDFINTRDFAPTILEAAGVPAAPTITGKSFVNVLKSAKSGIVDASRDMMIVAKERHDLGRPNDGGYPVRAIRTREFLYVRNYEPERWPAGEPETGYRNVDDSPSKTNIISSFDKYYQLSFGKRAPEELFDMLQDPECLNNLAKKPEFALTKRKLRERMEETLRGEGDPRMLGRADFFETIEYVGPRKHSYEEWLKHRQP